MGSTLFLMLLAMLPGCSTPEKDAVTDAVVPSKDAKPPPKSAKGKQKAGKGKTAKGGKNGKTQPPAGPPPIGSPGPATGELKLVLNEIPVEVPDPIIPGAPPPPSGKTTQATITFAFSDGTTKDVPVGKVPGNCTEAVPKPIGPDGKEQTPLWAVQCVDGDSTVDIAIAQLGQSVSVLRAPKAAEGVTPQYKIVKRVRLVPGVTLTKKQG